DAVTVSGTYYIKATSAAGCEAIKPVTVTVNPLPVLTITNPDAVCTPGSVDLTASAVTSGSELQGGLLSYWTDAAGTVSLSNPDAVTVSGTYYIKATSAAGCEAIEPVTVT